MSHNATPEEQERILRTVLTRGSNASLSNPIPVIPVGTVTTEDTGVNTNPERWLHENHWESDEVDTSAGVAQNLGGLVPAGETRRIRELTIRHGGTNFIIVTLRVQGGATKLSLLIDPNSERVWSSQDGREFTAGQQPEVISTVAINGVTVISASGVEA